MKAIVDKDGCIACGLCINVCPEVFQFDDNGLAEAYAPVSPAAVTTAEDARDGCPVSVISLEE